ncbi:DR2241 family protein [Halobellus salinisoli]|uniref:DR2241 family protein n=1 Tax=Halobellus salinisoli TaxID=3108500 RepID=UPI0030085F2B
MTDVRDEQIEALVEQLTSGSDPIDFDGLHAAATEDGYALSTPEGGEYEGLSEADLRAAAGDGGVAPYVTNWYYWEEVVGHRGRHRRAFLRHAEAAHEQTVPERYAALEDGMRTEWGEVVVTATLGAHGERRYEIRHTDDAGVDSGPLNVDSDTPDADSEALDRYDDPLDARELATYDDRGRYRPLKSAPSLVSGWVFDDLDGRDAVETLDVFYPASVANWNREREGDLDVTHWRETAERQTGIYDIVEDLPREAVEWVAQACCVDSQCLKRREWQYEEGDDLAADGGAGAFPCREPCSLVVAAARKWTKLAEEETHTYEFELTPSEKEQIEAIIDAVADGRVDEIREADVYEGANRYRTRYLRAKRFDDKGNLSGTPTHPNEE